MTSLHVKMETADSVAFEVRTKDGRRLEFTLIVNEFPDGSVKLLKDVGLPVVVSDFSYAGMD